MMLTPVLYRPTTIPSRNFSYSKFYGTPINISVLVYQINKLIVKSVIFEEKNCFLSSIINSYLSKTSTK